jgi:endonuclease/exonuclease/phosphatase family metal-dependent hydrolase
MSRRSVPEPPRHAQSPVGPSNRSLSVVSLALALLLFAVVGIALNLASPDPHSTAAELDPPATSSSTRPGPHVSVVTLANHATLAKKPPALHHKKPRIPRSFVKVSRGTAQATSFNVVSFNALGFSHTARGGDRRGWAPGTARMRAAVGILQAQDTSVVGFQEFQGPQYATFHAMAPDFQIYPGWSMGSQPLQNSIAWRTSDWELVKAQTLPIPYFYNRVAMPQVLLRNVHTGREVWFGNFHNPADKFHPAQGARVAATAVEAAATRGFVAAGYPVILTGDMNERESYFCRISTLAPLHGADGAYRDSAGCHTVSPTPVDWITGTTSVQFSSYLRDTSTTSRRISDHFLIKATATLPPERSLKRCVPAPHDPTAVYCPPKGQH